MLRPLVPRLPPDPVLDALPSAGRRLVLVTAHRRESFGPDLLAITQGLRRLARGFPDVDIVYPVHLNPQVDGPVRESLAEAASRLLRDREAYARRARPTSAFGDGRAAPRIAHVLLQGAR